MARYRHAVVVAVAAGAVLVASAVVVTTAQAGGAVQGQVQGQHCTVGAADNPSCMLAEPVKMPLSIAVSVTTQPAENATVTWTVSCSRNGNPASKSGTSTGMTPFQAKLAAPGTNAADCTVNASVTATGQASMTAGLVYTLGRPVMIDIAQGANYSGQPVYDLRCLTDPGNNPAAGTKVVIMGCETLYSQAWTMQNGELMHGRYCLTDKGNGGIRTKLVLAACTGAADQRWTFRLPQAHATEGAFVVAAHGGALCLDDPKTSVAPGTQLIIFTCNNGASQKWYLG